MKHPCNVTKALSFYEFRILFRDFCKTRTCFVFCWQKETVPSFQDKVDWGERRGVWWLCRKIFESKHNWLHICSETVIEVLAIEVLLEIWTSCGWVFVSDPRTTYFFALSSRRVFSWQHRYEVFNTRMLLPPGIPLVCVLHWHGAIDFQLKTESSEQLVMVNLCCHRNAGRHISKFCSVGLEPF